MIFSQGLARDESKNIARNYFVNNTFVLHDWPCYPFLILFFFFIPDSFVSDVVEGI